MGEVAATSRDAILGSVQVAHHYPTENGGQAQEISIDPTGVHDAFAADLPTEVTAVLAATQRPISEFGFSDASGPPAWKNLPSWAIVAKGDEAAGADLTRSMAERAGAKITELEGSHVIMVSQPDAVTDVILQAVDAATRVPVGA